MDWSAAGAAVLDGIDGLDGVDGIDGVDGMGVFIFVLGLGWWFFFF